MSGQADDHILDAHLLDYEEGESCSPPSPSVLEEARELEEEQDNYNSPPKESPNSTLPRSEASTTIRPVETVTSLESNISLMDVDVESRPESDVQMPTQPNTSGEDLSEPAQVNLFQPPIHIRIKNGNIVQVPDTTDFGQKFHHSWGVLIEKLRPFSKNHRGGRTTIWSARMRDRKTGEVLDSIKDELTNLIHDLFRDRDITLKDGPPQGPQEPPKTPVEEPSEEPRERCHCKVYHDNMVNCPADGPNHFKFCQKVMEARSGTSSGNSSNPTPTPSLPSPRPPVSSPSPAKSLDPIPSTSRQSRDPMPPPNRGRGRGRGRASRSRSNWRERQAQNAEKEIEKAEQRLDMLRAKRSQSTSSSQNSYERPKKKPTAQDRLFPKVPQPDHPTPAQFAKLMATAGTPAQSSASVPTMVAPPVVTTSTMVTPATPRPSPLFPGLGINFSPRPAQHGDPVTLGPDGLPDYRTRPQKPAYLPGNVVFDVTIVDGKWHVSLKTH
jgi:hypothetical protein